MANRLENIRNMEVPKNFKQANRSYKILQDTQNQFKRFGVVGLGTEHLLDMAKLFDEGKTKVKYPKGRHNRNPSKAVDVTPYPVNWEDRERQTLFAGFVLGIANQMGIHIRWGGDWDCDFEVHDNRFDDFPHFELKDV